MSTGGPIQEISIRGRIFSVTADSDAKLALGGYKNKREMNGNGSSRLIKEAVAWSTAGLKIDCDPNRADQEFLQEVADGTTDEDITCTLVTGITYGGKGNIDEEIVYDAKSSTCELLLTGGGKLEAQ